MYWIAFIVESASVWGKLGWFVNCQSNQIIVCILYLCTHTAVMSILILQAVITDKPVSLMQFQAPPQHNKQTCVVAAFGQPSTSPCLPQGVLALCVWVKYYWWLKSAWQTLVQLPRCCFDLRAGLHDAVRKIPVIETWSTQAALQKVSQIWEDECSFAYSPGYLFKFWRLVNLF